MSSVCVCGPTPGISDARPNEPFLCRVHSSFYDYGWNATAAGTINLFDKNSVETSIIDKMSGRNFINGARANDCHLIYP